jgi:sorbitol/mannitol transport system permease protein
MKTSTRPPGSSLGAILPARPDRHKKSLVGGRAVTRAFPLLPALGLVIAITQVPFVMTIYYSSQHWILTSMTPQHFVGIGNFVAAVQDNVFRQSLLNTFVLVLSTIAISLTMGTILALGLNRDFPGRGFVRTLAITPFFVMPVAAALFWKAAFYDPSFGALGWITSALGFGRINWLTHFPMFSVVLLTSWRWTAFALLIILAGLQSFPIETGEAARLDGAGSGSMLRYFVLPHLRPFLELSALMIAMFVLQSFGEIAMMTAGGPAYATSTVAYYIYLQAFSAFNLGQAAAYGVVALIISIALVMPTLRILSGVFQAGGRR